MTEFVMQVFPNMVVQTKYQYHIIHSDAFVFFYVIRAFRQLVCYL